MAKTMLAISLLMGAGACSSAPAPRAAPTTSTLDPTTTTELPTTTTTVSVETTTTTEPAPEPVEEVPEVTEAPRARSAPTTAEYEAPEPVSRAPRQGGGGWAIPDYIVACESGGSWEAENPSGAAGPYQLMPEHFGGESALNQSQEAQHAKAAELWDGGRGASNWEQCL